MFHSFNCFFGSDSNCVIGFNKGGFVDKICGIFSAQISPEANGKVYKEKGKEILIIK